jgi:2-oxoglutarate dehydrogenase E1 component
VKESFLSGTSSVALETMFELWKRNPSKVHESWQRYFQNIESGAQGEAAPDLLRPVSLGKDSVCNILNNKGTIMDTLIN